MYLNFFVTYLHDFCKGAGHGGNVMETEHRASQLNVLGNNDFGSVVQKASEGGAHLIFDPRLQLRKAISCNPLTLSERFQIQSVFIDFVIQAFS